MNRPVPDNFTEILNRCISWLQDGRGLESTLAEFPEQADRLRPILEAVLLVWSSRDMDTVPVAAMQRSRGRLLDAAAAMRNAPKTPWWLGVMRGALAPVMILLFGAVLLFTGIASAQALPGQPLYSFKLAAEQISLALPGSPSVQLARETRYDLRRKDEIEELLSHQLEREVELAGFLMRAEDGSWTIDRLKVLINPLILEETEQLAGRYVSVHADLLTSGEIVVEVIQARLYSVNGKITQIEAGQVLIGDQWVRIGPDVQGVQNLKLGQEVRASVTRLADGGYEAVRIEWMGEVAVEGPKLSETPDTLQDQTETEVEPVSPPPAQATPHLTDPTQETAPEDHPKSATSAPAATSTPQEWHNEHPNSTSQADGHPTPTPAPTRRYGDEHHASPSPTHRSKE